MASLEHPLKDAIEAVRRAILGVDLSIQEGIKWNSPSFKTHEWFATVNLRGKNGDDRVWLILHAGAKAGPNLKARLANSDPEALLTWLGKDRAMVVFESKADVRGKKPALAAIVRAWIGLI